MITFGYLSYQQKYLGKNKRFICAEDEN